MSNYNPGDKVVSSSCFTSAIGVHIKRGAPMTVEMVGRSVRLRADLCGSVVWISDGLILTDDTAPRWCACPGATCTRRR